MRSASPDTTPSTLKRLVTFLILSSLAVLSACGGSGMAFAPELVVRDAITARAFGNDVCFLSLPEGVPAYLNPDPEQSSVGEAAAGEAEAVQAVTLRDGSLWYQFADGVWVRVDGTAYTTRGDCRP